MVNTPETMREPALLRAIQEARRQEVYPAEVQYGPPPIITLGAVNLDKSGWKPYNEHRRRQRPINGRPRRPPPIRQPGLLTDAQQHGLLQNVKQQLQQAKRHGQRPGELSLNYHAATRGHVHNQPPRLYDMDALRSDVRIQGQGQVTTPQYNSGEGQSWDRPRQPAGDRTQFPTATTSVDRVTVVGNVATTPSYPERETVPDRYGGSFVVTPVENYQSDGRVPAHNPSQFGERIRGKYPAARPSSHYGSSQKGHKSKGKYPAARPSSHYGAPQHKPKGKYPAARPSSHYGAPQQKSKGKYPAARPSSHYGAPPQKSKGKYPAARPSSHYGAPQQKSKGKYPAARPSSHYGAPQQKAKGKYPAARPSHYGAPSKGNKSKGKYPAARPSSHYGTPSKGHNAKGKYPAARPSSHYGAPAGGHKKPAYTGPIWTEVGGASSGGDCQCSTYNNIGAAVGGTTFVLNAVLFVLLAIANGGGLGRQLIGGGSRGAGSRTAPDSLAALNSDVTSQLPPLSPEISHQALRFACDLMGFTEPDFTGYPNYVLDNEFSGGKKPPKGMITIAEVVGEQGVQTMGSVFINETAQAGGPGFIRGNYTWGIHSSNTTAANGAGQTTGNRPTSDGGGGSLDGLDAGSHGGSSGGSDGSQITWILPSDGTVDARPSIPAAQPQVLQPTQDGGASADGTVSGTANPTGSGFLTSFGGLQSNGSPGDITKPGSLIQPSNGSVTTSASFSTSSSTSSSQTVPVVSTASSSSTTGTVSSSLTSPSSPCRGGSCLETVHGLIPLGSPPAPPGGALATQESQKPLGLVTADSFRPPVLLPPEYVVSSDGSRPPSLASQSLSPSNPPSAPASFATPSPAPFISAVPPLPSSDNPQQIKPQDIGAVPSLAELFEDIDVGLSAPASSSSAELNVTKSDGTATYVIQNQTIITAAGQRPSLLTSSHQITTSQVGPPASGVAPHPSHVQHLIDGLLAVTDIENDVDPTVSKPTLENGDETIITNPVNGVPSGTAGSAITWIRPGSETRPAFASTAITTSSPSPSTGGLTTSPGSSSETGPENAPNRVPSLSPGTSPQGVLTPTTAVTASGIGGSSVLIAQKPGSTTTSTQTTDVFTSEIPSTSSTSSIFSSGTQIFSVVPSRLPPAESSKPSITKPSVASASAGFTAGSRPVTTSSTTSVLGASLPSLIPPGQSPPAALTSSATTPNIILSGTTAGTTATTTSTGSTPGVGNTAPSSQTSQTPSSFTSSTKEPLGSTSGSSNLVTFESFTSSGASTSGIVTWRPSVASTGSLSSASTAISSAPSSVASEAPITPRPISMSRPSSTPSPPVMTPKPVETTESDSMVSSIMGSINSIISGFVGGTSQPSVPGTTTANTAGVPNRPGSGTTSTTTQAITSQSGVVPQAGYLEELVSFLIPSVTPEPDTGSIGVRPPSPQPAPPTQPATLPPFTETVSTSTSSTEVSSSLKPQTSATSTQSEFLTSQSGLVTAGPPASSVTLAPILVMGGMGLPEMTTSQVGLGQWFEETDKDKEEQKPTTSGPTTATTATTGSDLGSTTEALSTLGTVEDHTETPYPDGTFGFTIVPTDPITVSTDSPAMPQPAAAPLPEDDAQFDLRVPPTPATELPSSTDGDANLFGDQLITFNDLGFWKPKPTRPESFLSIKPEWMRPPAGNNIIGSMFQTSEGGYQEQEVRPPGQQDDDQVVYMGPPKEMEISTLFQQLQQENQRLKEQQQLLLKQQQKLQQLAQQQQLESDLLDAGLDLREPPAAPTSAPPANPESSTLPDNFITIQQIDPATPMMMMMMARLNATDSPIISFTPQKPTTAPTLQQLQGSDVQARPTAWAVPQTPAATLRPQQDSAVGAVSTGQNSGTSLASFSSSSSFTTGPVWSTNALDGADGGATLELTSSEKTTESSSTSFEDIPPSVTTAPVQISFEPAATSIPGPADGIFEETNTINQEPASAVASSLPSQNTQRPFTDEQQGTITSFTEASILRVPPPEPATTNTQAAARPSTATQHSPESMTFNSLGFWKPTRRPVSLGLLKLRQKQTAKPLQQQHQQDKDTAVEIKTQQQQQEQEQQDLLFFQKQKEQQKQTEQYLSQQQQQQEQQDLQEQAQQDLLLLKQQQEQQKQTEQYLSHQDSLFLKQQQEQQKQTEQYLSQQAQQDSLFLKQQQEQQKQTEQYLSQQAQQEQALQTTTQPPPTITTPAPTLSTISQESLPGLLGSLFASLGVTDPPQTAGTLPSGEAVPPTSRPWYIIGPVMSTTNDAGPLGETVTEVTVEMDDSGEIDWLSTLEALRTPPPGKGTSETSNLPEQAGGYLEGVTDPVRVQTASAGSTFTRRPTTSSAGGVSDLFTPINDLDGLNFIDRLTTDPSVVVSSSSSYSTSTSFTPVGSVSTVSSPSSTSTIPQFNKYGFWKPSRRPHPSLMERLRQRHRRRSTTPEPEQLRPLLPAKISYIQQHLHPDRFQLSERLFGHKRRPLGGKSGRFKRNVLDKPTLRVTDELSTTPGMQRKPDVIKPDEEFHSTLRRISDVRARSGIHVKKRDTRDTVDIKHHKYNSLFDTDSDEDILRLLTALETTSTAIANTSHHTTPPDVTQREGRTIANNSATDLSSLFRSARHSLASDAEARAADHAARSFRRQFSSLRFTGRCLTQCWLGTVGILGSVGVLAAITLPVYALLVAASAGGAAAGAAAGGGSSSGGGGGGGGGVGIFPFVVFNDPVPSGPSGPSGPTGPSGLVEIPDLSLPSAPGVPPGDLGTGPPTAPGDEVKPDPAEAELSAPGGVAGPPGGTGDAAGAPAPPPLPPGITSDLKLPGTPPPLDFGAVEVDYEDYEGEPTPDQLDEGFFKLPPAGAILPPAPPVSPGAAAPAPPHGEPIGTPTAPIDVNSASAVLGEHFGTDVTDCSNYKLCLLHSTTAAADSGHRWGADYGHRRPPQWFFSTYLYEGSFSELCHQMSRPPTAQLCRQLFPHCLPSDGRKLNL